MQHKKTLFQQAKLKPESTVPPCLEGQHSNEETMVVHEVKSVSPLLPPFSEKPVMNEERPNFTAVTTVAKTVEESALKEEKDWKEMKLNLDTLPNILARLTKIKLTGRSFSFLLWNCFYYMYIFFFYFDFSIFFFKVLQPNTVLSKY